MQAGLMRHKVTIQRDAADTFGSRGESVPRWVTFTDIWADIKPSGGIKTPLGHRVDPIATHLVTTRFYQGVTPAMRILYGERVLNIVTVHDDDERRRMLEFQCREQK